MRGWTLPAVVAPPLVLAAVGLTHPHHLTAETADWWTTMHILLVPVFPLLGVALWLLLRAETGVLAWLARVAAFSYAVFYGALDAIAGVGTGVLVRNGAGDATGPAPEVARLFAVGNDLGGIGAWSFLVAAALTAVVLFLRHGRRALPGGVVVVAAAVPFLGSHIYWPDGVLTMLALAVGLGLLAAFTGRPVTAADPVAPASVSAP